MKVDDAAGVHRRCGCTDPVTGRRLGRRCPKLSDAAHGSWYFTAFLPDEQVGSLRLRRGGFRSAQQAARQPLAAPS